MTSSTCDFSCPPLCISVGSNTPVLPLGIITNIYSKGNRQVEKGDEPVQ